MATILDKRKREQKLIFTFTYLGSAIKKNGQNFVSFTKKLQLSMT